MTLATVREAGYDIRRHGGQWQVVRATDPPTPAGRLYPSRQKAMEAFSQTFGRAIGAMFDSWFTETQVRQ